MKESNEAQAVVKYTAVADSLKGKIVKGLYPAGGKIPSENEITRDYHVSVITARKALSELTNEGLIYRIKGKGTFVGQKEKAETAAVGKCMKVITLSVLMYQNSDSSTMQIIRGAQSALSAKGYSLIVECCNDDENEETRILEQCLEKKVDGVLLFSVDPDKSAATLHKLRSNGIPFVLIDRGLSQFPANLVSAYNLDGTYKLTNYLLENGHRNIAFASQDMHIVTERNRLDGFRMALQEYNMPFQEALCVNHITKNLNSLDALVKAGKVTAVVCVNDKCALKVIDHFREIGVRVPEDVSVAGFDDTEIGRYHSPALTTVSQPFAEIGSAAANRLTELIEKETDDNLQIFLPVKLIVRQSTAPVADDNR